MKMRDFPDWMNPVLVKELRQSLHDKSIVFAAGIVIAAELLVYYIEQVAGTSQLLRRGSEITPAFGLFYWILGLATCGLCAYAVWRNGRERGHEGFDPGLGTGYPPGKIVLGHVLSILCHLLIPLVIGLPCILWSIRFPELREPGLWCAVCSALLAFACCMQFAVTAQNGKKALPFWAVLLILWIAGGPVFGILAALKQNCSLYPVSILFLFAAVTAACGELALLMPPNADRAQPVKCAFYVLTAYAACWAERCGNNCGGILIAAGLLLMFASMLERFVPSRRQIGEAPQNPVLRGLSLLYGTGVLPGFLAAVLLTGAGTAVILSRQGDNGWGAALLIAVFYFQTALFLAQRFHQPPVWMVLLILILCNIPMIGGVSMPWGTALSLGGSAFLEDGAALWAAGIACATGIALNLELYRNFVKRYFERKVQK